MGPQPVTLSAVFDSIKIPSFERQWSFVTSKDSKDRSVPMDQLKNGTDEESSQGPALSPASSYEKCSSVEPSSSLRVDPPRSGPWHQIADTIEKWKNNVFQNNGAAATVTKQKEVTENEQSSDDVLVQADLKEEEPHTVTSHAHDDSAKSSENGTASTKKTVFEIMKSWKLKLFKNNECISPVQPETVSSDSDEPQITGENNVIQKEQLLSKPFSRNNSVEGMSHISVAQGTPNIERGEPWRPLRAKINAFWRRCRMLGLRIVSFVKQLVSKTTNFDTKCEGR